MVEVSFMEDNPTTKLSGQSKAFKTFRFMFYAESLLSIQRVSVTGTGSAPGPPSTISRLYSVLVSGLLFYAAYSSVTTLLSSNSGSSLFSCAAIFYISCLLFMHCSILIKTVFVDCSKTTKLFEMLRDIDDDLNFPADHKIFRSSSINNHLLLGGVIASYLSLWYLWSDIGYVRREDLPIIALMALFDLELLICASFLACVRVRIRHLTAHITHKFSLRPKNDVLIKRWHRFLPNWTPYEIHADTATFDVDLRSVYKQYDKLLEIFHLINSLFQLQVVLFFFTNFTSVLMSIFLFIETMQTQEVSFVVWLAAINWWVRMAVSICYPCMYAEGVTIAVDDLKTMFLVLLGRPSYEEHHAAVAPLLRYCEVSQPRFSVYRLFCMDMHLPFTFASIVVTYLIVLLQFRFNSADIN